jgi:hypothetical protein
MRKNLTTHTNRNRSTTYFEAPHPMSWGVSVTLSNVAHVYPLNDLRRHSLRDCWCHPLEDDGVVVHNSLDGREQYQSGERRPS